MRKWYKTLQNLCNYDWVPVPLGYSQIVFVFVRLYFLLCLVARQSFKQLEETDAPQPHFYLTYDKYVPFMTIIQFVIFMAWLKVAEVLLNPFGEDDDDFECDFVIDRNITVAMLLADKFHDTVGEMDMPDRFQGMDHLLYSEGSVRSPQHPLVGSAAKLEAKGYLPSPKVRIRMVPRAPSTEEDLHAVVRTKFTSAREPNMIQRGIAWRRFSSRVKTFLSFRSKQPAGRGRPNDL